MNPFRSTKTVLLVIAAIVIGGLSYLGYWLNEENKALKSTVAKLEDTLDVTQKNLTEMTENSKSLLEALAAEQQKAGFLKEQADTFGAAVQKLTGTVTNLEKLTKTDPELLIKYSKVYFLNEHYTPASLALIPSMFVFQGKEEYFNAQAVARLEQLLMAAQQAGAEIKLISAYRSFDTQKDLKSKYKVTYGSGANTFSAEQGYSEHQLGTAVDFTSASLGAAFERIDTTTQYFWLQENAYKYGFVLSYPKGNSYYIYEPWHWRFVGIELATKLYTEKKRFYDMDQREINDYLVKIFD
ncbi:MAG: M15 family metallopeptidase [bacterium]|nr:M15 family metallopeptidase [bacterium]